ncbi:hypothetical protein [Actinomadura atramentaria]|uniref:hypothetical protein n=1 Tax=Actinomadura atramentaria TaxID=1990 RepID=UPI00037DED4B|nr:hypothetical protein [Actinomadura atramentaria]
MAIERSHEGARARWRPAYTPVNQPSQNAQHGGDIPVPTTDGEFLDTCLAMAARLRGLAVSLEVWSGALAALGVPAEVISWLDVSAHSLYEAADGATRSALTFATVFEDARDLAARGLHITGES